MRTGQKFALGLHGRSWRSDGLCACGAREIRNFVRRSGRGHHRGIPRIRAGAGEAVCGRGARGRACSPAIWRSSIARGVTSRSAADASWSSAATSVGEPTCGPPSTASSTSIRTIDVLVNNAGVIQVGPLEHMSEEDFENANATHYPRTAESDARGRAHHAAPGFGRIVNIASFGGRVAVPHMAPYCSEQVRARRPVGCRARRARSTRHPRDDGQPGADANGLAASGACSRASTISEFALFKTASSIPWHHDIGRACGAEDCRGLPLR